MQKVFGIGFHKTGTTTLESVLTNLGYKVCGPKRELLDSIKSNDLKHIFQLVEKYDAFEDVPWPLIFTELDRKYPNSKFILTTRDSDKWIKSIVKHFGSSKTKMREFIYGVGDPRGNEEIYIERYINHNESVKAYFKDRPNDLLIIDWSKENDLSRIYDFLNIELPPNRVPHSNSGDARKYEYIRKIKSNFKVGLKSFFAKLK